jgi:hypothetical protein
LAAIGLSAAMAFTRPFTPGSEAVTAAVLVVFVAIVALQFFDRAPLPLTARRPPRRYPGGPPASSADRQRWTARWSPWLGLVAATVGWELFCYLSSPRHAHPTLSSMLDAAGATHTGRGVAFALWLVLGWYLATR